jgi:hypothetical protein
LLVLLRKQKYECCALKCEFLKVDEKTLNERRTKKKVWRTGEKFQAWGFPIVLVSSSIRAWMEKKKKMSLSYPFIYFFRFLVKENMSAHSGDELDIDIKEQDRFLPIAK